LTIDTIACVVLAFAHTCPLYTSNEIVVLRDSENKRLFFTKKAIFLLYHDLKTKERLGKVWTLEKNEGVLKPL